MNCNRNCKSALCNPGWRILFMEQNITAQCASKMAFLSSRDWQIYLTLSDGSNVSLYYIVSYLITNFDFYLNLTPQDWSFWFYGEKGLYSQYERLEYLFSDNNFNENAAKCAAERFKTSTSHEINHFLSEHYSVKIVRYFKRKHVLPLTALCILEVNFNDIPETLRTVLCVPNICHCE